MRILACGFVLVVLAFPCWGATIVVDQNGSGDFTNIQDAINYSWDGDVIEVWPGTYNEAVKFNGRAITLTSSDPNNPSVVSSTVIQYNSGTAQPPQTAVVTFDFSEDSKSVITGFSIKGYGTNGEGIYCYASSPMILKNVIQNCNYKGVYGQNASPTISNNKIINNKGGIVGCGGLICNNIISGNTNHNPGGGLSYCNGTITNNIISGNQGGSDGSGNSGGGLYACNGIIINNTIVGNQVAIGGSNRCGGGIYDCSGVIKNNIIAFNIADIGGGIYISGGKLCHNSYNDFWMNYNGNFGGNAAAGIGDIARDPLFAGDYYLKSTAGRYDPSTETWVLDDADSPCIDKGDPNDPIGTEPNPNGGRINIGSYGGTSQASKSPSGIVQPVCTEYPAMDFNKDCKADYKDFAIFVQSWLQCNLDPPSECGE
jgi:parallel beta-helix repeat protein